jgi:hypothetical protein
MALKRRPPEVQSLPMRLLYFLFRQETHVYVDGNQLIIHTYGYLYDWKQHIAVGSAEWLEWIEKNTSFHFSNDKVWCLFQKERRRNTYYWYAYKWHTSKRRAEKVYVGKLAELSPREIIAKAMELERRAQFTKAEIARKRAIATRSRQRKRRMEQARARRDMRAEK